ncbi:hypothetical protein [Paenibacillus sp. QZ-Y1]|uniref:hypothetical protein n=1 Tax=Paenibacillus sp. QZ-Y1 TaxID=3414511 RepID=UPI003F793D9F
MDHDVAEFFQVILLNIDMLHNLQRLEPASAGLLALDEKVAGRYNMLFEAIRQTGAIGN